MKIRIALILVLVVTMIVSVAAINASEKQDQPIVPKEKMILWNGVDLIGCRSGQDVVGCRWRDSLWWKTLRLYAH